MNHQADLGEKLAESPKRIWLAPACNVDERTWCEDDVGCCDECGEPTVEYVRADLVEKLKEEARYAGTILTSVARGRRPAKRG